MHGSALVVFNFWKLLNIKVPKFLGWLVTFNFVNIAWIFFRANDFEKALYILKEMFNISSAKFSVEFATFINTIIAHPLLIIRGSEISTLFTSVETIKYLLVFGLIAFTFPNTMQLINLIPYDGKWAFKPTFKFALIFAVLAYLALLQFVGNTVHSEFLYFNF